MRDQRSDRSAFVVGALLSAATLGLVPRVVDAADAPLMRDRPLAVAHVAVDGIAPAAHPHRIVVKYAAAVSACAHCLLERGTRFADVARSGDSLDRLHTRFGVARARSLFHHDHEAHHESTFARSAAAERRLDGVRARFPLRAARAPSRSGATAAPDLSNAFVLELGAGADPIEAAAAFRADRNVEYAEPDYLMTPAFVPDDPYFASSGAIAPGMPDLWGLHATHAAEAWDTASGNGIVVAVVDTGVNLRHADLEANAWSNPGEVRNRVDDDGNGYVDDVGGWDFTKDSGKIRDRHGHGTHVGGTIAATAHNGIGVVGMAHGARVMSVAGLNAKGFGYTSDLAECIVYAAENGADVLNNSWGGPDSDLIRDAVATATSVGAVLVFAAGNAASSYLGPAADRNVIAVAASEYGDTAAWFSNWGQGISVAAPGVDVLSLRGANRVGGEVVGKRYRVLSGTSMAAPHVSGAVAMLLEAKPALTTDEVRWHLELSADQPGHPGYEGERFNPFLGWGRLDAARMFDDPPVTTRITSAPVAIHGIENTTVPDVAPLELSFTTHDEIAWTLSTPAWLTAPIAGGSGTAVAWLSFDAAGLAPGAHTGAIAVSAPAAADGGTSAQAVAHVHHENRVGDEIVVSASLWQWGDFRRPATASDGQGVLAAWTELNSSLALPPQIVAAYIDDAGSVTGPLVLHTTDCAFFCGNPNPSAVSIAFDGTTFLVAWLEDIQAFVNGPGSRTENRMSVKALRVTAAGQVLDATPIVVSTNVEVEGNDGGYDQYWDLLTVGFDGTAFTAIWRHLDYGSGNRPVEVYLRRLAPGGAPLSPRRTIYPLDTTALYQAIRPRMACAAGTCLVAWEEFDGETTPTGRYIYKAYGQRYDADHALDDVPVRLVGDMFSVNAIATDGEGFFLAGYRYERPTANSSGYAIVGARVALDGTPLDPAGISLQRGGLLPFASFAGTNGAVFDGDSYVVTWAQVGDEFPACYPFAARVGSGGAVLDDEEPGLLLAPSDSMPCGAPALAPTATKSLLIWADGPYPAPRILARGAFPR